MSAINVHSFLVPVQEVRGPAEDGEDAEDDHGEEDGLVGLFGEARDEPVGDEEGGLRVVVGECLRPEAGGLVADDALEDDDKAQEPDAQAQQLGLFSIRRGW